MENLTWAEIAYCANPIHFWECQQWAVISFFAARVSEETIPRSKPNGRQDALRHCIWQACLTSALGWRLAKKFGDLHEDWRGNPAKERAMDQSNNFWGRIVGLAWGKPPKVRRFVGPCLKLLNLGVLRRLAD